MYFGVSVGDIQCFNESVDSRVYIQVYIQRENLYVCRMEYTYEVDIREYSGQSTYCNVPISDSHIHIKVRYNVILECMRTNVYTILYIYFRYIAYNKMIYFMCSYIFIFI